MKRFTILSGILLCLLSVARADFGAFAYTTFASSPDGNLLVRITTIKAEEGKDQTDKYELSFYIFDQKQDSYVRSSKVPFDRPPGLMYVSDAGDIVGIDVNRKKCMSLYSKEGKLVKSWALEEILTKDEIEACAETGATLQWFEEGCFVERHFSFRGPSRLIRVVMPPLTVMRGANLKVKFSGSVDAETLKLTKDEPDES